MTRPTPSARSKIPPRSFTRLGVVAATLACACSGAPDREPAPAMDDFAFASTLSRALESALTTAGDARREGIEHAIAVVREHEGVTQADTGLERALLLLRAANIRDRDARVADLESQYDVDGDEIADRLVDAALERDPLWFATALESDTLYSDFAAFLNGVIQSVASALSGNPIGTLQPLVVGIEGVLDGLPLDPRDRARLALERRLRLEGLAPSEGSDLERRVETLRDQTCREELAMSRGALERGEHAAALAHARVADFTGVRTDEVEEARVAVKKAANRSRERLVAALAIDPIEPGILTDQHARETYVAYVEALLSRSERAIEASQLELSDRASIHTVVAAEAVSYADALRRVGRDGRGARHVLEEHVENYPAAATSRRAEWLLASPLLEPTVEVDAAYAARRKATWRFVFTGSRDVTDPLQRYPAARRAETRTWLDVVAPILWLPATIVRSVYSAVGNPIDDRPLIEAESRFVRAASDHPARPEILRDLAERHDDRGDHWKALLTLREADASNEERAPVERALAESLLADDASPAIRRARIEWLKSTLPGTPWESAAAAEIAKLDARAAAGMPDEPVAVPLSVARALSLLPDVDDRLANGDDRDGEIDPARVDVDVTTGRAFVTVREGSSERREEVAKDPARSSALVALASEWRWRHAAARAETYRLLHRGVPVELYAGFGVNGLAMYPRLLPEDYTSRDERWYR